jgi:hypothetical protein
MDNQQTIVVGIIAGVTLLLELLGLIFAVHNTVKYLYKQKRYKGNGLSLIVFYTLSILIFSFRIWQILTIVNPKVIGVSAKAAYIIGTSIVMFEFDVGVTMIMLIIQL